MIAWFARSPVAANLLMGLIVLGGLLTLPSLPRQFFPQRVSNQILVTVPYPGAGPEEIEQGICLPIEARLEGTRGVRQIRSTAMAGLASVVIELEDGADARKALDEIENRVASIAEMPDEAERPRIHEVEIPEQVAMMAVFGEADLRSLRRVTEKVREDLVDMPTISRVEIVGAPPWEISIEVSDSQLQRLGLTLDEVAAAVRRESVELPSGTLRGNDREIRLRSDGQAYDADGFAQLSLRSRPDGSRLTLGEVAKIHDGFREGDGRPRFDGLPALFLAIFRNGEEQTPEIAESLQKYAEDAHLTLPEGIRAVVWQDESRYLASQLDSLSENAILGFLLVVGTLSLFLRPRLAAWISLGIPVSLLGAIWAMPSLDLSIDVISLFALLVVLGIVVDDAVVVGENIYRCHQQGFEGVEAAIRGTREVALPVVISMGTTVAAFAPLLAIPGNAGQAMRVIPKVVTLVLIFSLVECLLILPAHLANLPRHQGPPGPWRRIRAFFERGLQASIDRVYSPLLGIALEARYAAVAVAVALMVITLGLTASGHLRFLFFPPIEADNVVALLTLPPGTPTEKTSEALGILEESAQRLRSELDGEGGGEPTIRHIVTSVGGQPFVARQTFYTSGIGESLSGSHLGEVNLELAPSETRDLRASEILRRWRQLTPAIPDAVESRFDASLFSAGRPVEMQIASRHPETLRQAVAEIEAALEARPGVVDITHSLRGGPPELDFELTAEGAALGLTRLDLATQVRRAFHGEEIQRIQRGTEDVRVRVRYDRRQRRTLANLESFRIRTPEGGQVPLSVVAQFRPSHGVTTIERTHGRRTATLGADVDLATTTPNQVVAALEASTLPRLRREFSDLSIRWKGEQEDQSRALGGLARGFAIAVFVIYALLALGFGTYLQPLVVMVAIPFGLIGSFWGHWLLGLDLTIYSLFGIVALSGVIVNDSLVLVDFANRARTRGTPLVEALQYAGASRFRPIVLTSATTFVGLLPLVLERSLQAQFLIPMAVSISFGLLIGTPIVLLLVPAIYRVLDDFTSPSSSSPSSTERSPGPTGTPPAIPPSPTSPPFDPEGNLSSTPPELTDDARSVVSSRPRGDAGLATQDPGERGRLRDNMPPSSPDYSRAPSPGDRDT